jgi:hydroxyethylthiazole kinase-like sugar kinase family protein
MKHIILNIVVVMLISISSIAQNNKIVTDTITIRGNCGECKARIEEAAYIKGVKTAEWNKTTKILTVVYNTDKTTLDKIATSISKVGHDSQHHTASDKSYQSLPSCCAYRTGVCAHD